MVLHNNPLKSPWLSARQVADRMAVSPKTIYAWIENRGLPAVRMFSNGSVRIPENEFLRWLEIKSNRA